jgi:hypothetical protein
LPKIQADVLLNFEKCRYSHSYYLVGAETTNKYFAPKAGFSLLGL